MRLKFKTFRILAVLGGLALFIGTCTVAQRALTSRASQAHPAVTAKAPAPTPAAQDFPMPTRPPPPAMHPHPPAPPVAVTPPAQPPAQTAMTTAEIKAAVDQWLTANGDRHGRQKLVDIMPDRPFRATAIRFREDDAVKFSNDPSQWSQIRLDLDRDGTDDEKWLLKNGRTYKRETLDRNGRTKATEYFRN